MEKETFNEAEKIKKEIDSMHSYKRKLFNARRFSSTCTIESYAKPNIEYVFNLKSEASEFINEMLEKEMDRVIHKIKELEEQFDNL